MRHEGEPSVEEILASIKKVIARDNPGRIPAPPRHKLFDNKADEPDEKAESETLTVSDSASGNILADDDEVLDLSEAEEYAEDQDNASESVEETAATAPADPPLTKPEAASSMRESLAALAMLSQPGAGSSASRQSETSLEELIRSMLRPMLAQWLDRHLPAIVERLVQDEIDRIAGKKS
ncbi:DUF2497 domain-containing protein [Altericroceibacterium spongiae]|uniref:DUF2497 domain-containing protein n=1 Tax=Altericroceibacterium spongiae TaxID=2320269 RepID=A0A420EEF8_9SPHN|nr:DUF2497 domain-containing protein [Altericroceibacterium spongiae]RKF19034.1 DUF2497 domain-containing protein [Altericroceibacterium spongiae]